MAGFEAEFEWAVILDPGDLGFVEVGVERGSDIVAGLHGYTWVGVVE